MDNEGDISTSGKNQLKNSNSLIPSVSMPEEKPPFFHCFNLLPMSGGGGVNHEDINYQTWHVYSQLKEELSPCLHYSLQTVYMHNCTFTLI